MSRTATVGGSAAGLAVGWNVANIGALADTVAGAYGVGFAAVGLLTTALFVVHLVAQLPAGRAVDRVGARRIGLVGLVWIAGANGLALIAPDFGLALGARALAGLGTAAAFIAGSDYVRAAGGSPLAQGIFGGANLGAGGLALALVPLFEGSMGWRAPFVTAAVVALFAAVILALGPRDATRRVTHRAGVHGIRATLRGDPPLWRLAVTHTTSFGLNVVVANWVVTLLLRAGEYGTAAAASIGALTLVAGIASRPFGGWIARNRPDVVRSAVAASLAAGALGTAILAFAGPLSLAVLGALILGVSAGIPFAAVFTGAARARPSGPGTAVAFVNASAGIAILAITPLVGLAFSLPGEGRLGFLLIAAVWAASLLALPSRREFGVTDTLTGRSRLT